ncbi:unnamed protein product [Meloidogyne enterolobii]|uniref:Uncharacterized protein n=1 Tax=Meloidogyne enterolobii TaxID=390850 RepID=A0ACB0XM46_MELEN
MDPTAIFWFIYSFYSATFIWNFYLTLRQYNVYRKTETRPEEVYEIISEEDFGYHRNYYLDKLTFDSYKLIILFCNLIPWLWSICGRYGLFIKPESGESFQSVLFILFYAFIEGLIELPFSYYETFYIDLKHGTKNETVSFFFIDRAKKFCLILLISSPLVAANAWIVQEGGQYSYIYVWAFVSVYLMLMAFIYPDVIAPLFDKYTPLQESELKTKIEALANKIGFPLKNIYVVEESKRSTHSNAYIFGFWKNKKIVLYDTLLGEEMNKSIQADQKTESETTTKTSSETFEEETNSKTTNKTLEGESLNMQHDEIVAILGHELGHWCEYHSMWMFIFAEV